MSSITDLLDMEAPQQKPNSTGFVLGTVAENNNKDFPTMVRVAFTAWTEGGDVSKWVPVLSPYAGGEYGRYLLPEVGDIVLVGFIGSMFEQPFVMGSFFPAGAKLPGEQFNDKNSNRHLKTKAGIILNLSDEDSKQSVRVETPKGLTLVIEDENETVTVSDKDGKNLIKIDSKNGAVEITAEKKIALKTGKCEISMDGNAGGMTLKADQLNVEAAQKAVIKSNNMMTIEGGMVTVDGKQTAKLNGGAMCEIAGGMVKIN